MNSCFVFFSEENESYGVFSQRFQLPVVVEVLHYETAEQYMMAKKAPLANDLDAYLRIMAEPDPSKCKRLGRKAKNLDLEVWDAWKREVVFNGNYAKYSQNPETKELLLSTAPKLLAEASPYDIVWGIGMRANDPSTADPTCWRGQDLLGCILMMVRKTLENEMFFSVGIR